MPRRTGRSGGNRVAGSLHDTGKAIPMKNSKRMLAVIAASGLALGSLPGVAQAQSVEIGLGVGAVVGSAALGAGLGLDAGSSGGDAPDLGSLISGGWPTPAALATA